MNALDPHSTVGQLVRERPSRARVFGRLGIDYCCGGARTLVLFSSSVAAGTLALRVTATFTDANGTPATEVAAREVAVPAQPEILAQETVP